MIYLTKGQTLKDNPGIVVYDPTGYYNDGDSIICASSAFPEEPACRYEAKFIAYGGIVYSISNPDDLMAEIIKLDPVSLFGKDSQQVAVDKVVEQIVPQESGEVIEEATTEKVETPVVETDTLPEAESVPEIEGTNGSTESGSTTTPVTTEVPPVDQTSTISVDENVVANTTTTTPEIEQVMETMTSTDNGLEST